VNCGKNRKTDEMEKERTDLETILSGLRLSISVNWVEMRHLVQSKLGYLGSARNGATKDK
jgi:hypothetical protein